MAFLQGALLLLLATPLLASPIPEPEETRCATRCPIFSKFGYESGHSYAYRYTADITTKMAGASTEVSALRMLADVWIEAISQCEYMLKMTYVTLVDRSSGSDASIEGASEFAEDLQRHPLRFAFVDGHIPDLCPEAEESDWVLNIKRAALSAFQNGMDDLRSNSRTSEEDISGSCTITNEVLDDSSEIIVKRTKDIHGCEGHHHVHSALQHTPFTSHAHKKTPPVFEVNSTCTQTFDADTILESVTCEEVHKLRPFSTGVSGATSEITVTMVKTQARTGVTGSEDTIHRRERMMFQHGSPHEHSHITIEAAREVLTSICQATENDVRPEVPGLFMDLVRALKRLDAASLRQLHGEAHGCPTAHKFFHDAVPNIKTLASLTLIKDLMQSGDVTGRTADLWVSSLAFSDDTPTVEMVNVAKDILALDSTPYRTMLSVSTLFNAYCSANPNCEDLPAIEAALAIFSENLRYNCRVNSEEHREKVMLTLKSIGNMGYASGLATILGRCIANDDAPMAIRVQAVDAFRRMPCSFETPEMMNLMDNANADPELRIKVYLALMRCPSVGIIEQVRHVLATEEINQVGSFMWTHLTNLMETASHYKQEVRAILEDQTLVKAFDLDRRKFSRNIELSMYNERLNMGGQLEGNVIFSHASFLPRSLDLNLTADFYGNSVNFVEVGGRVEGVEKVAEAMFKDKHPNEVLQTDLGTDTMTQALGETRAQVFMRVFGNELSYKDFLFSDLTSTESYNYLDFLINLASEHDVSFTKSLVLVTEELVHPTIAGMPLRLAVHGAATAHVQLMGHMDLRSAFTSPHAIDINGNIKPSAAIEFVGEMGVDAFVASTGLKLVTSLHTSTAATVNMQLLNGNDFSMDVNMPQDQVEILNIHSNVYLTKRNQQEALVLFPEDQFVAERCSGVCALTGLELCGDLSYPRVFHQETAPYFPLTGEARANLVLHKRDTHQGYHFETKLISDANSDIFKIAFDTPGSATSRLTSVEFNLNREGRTTSLVLISPWKKAELIGSYSDTDEMKEASARATIDDEHNYAITAQLEFIQNRLNVEYRPRLEIAILDEPAKVISGSVIYRENRRASIDFSIDNIFESTVGFSGEAKKVENSRINLYEVLLSATSPEFTGKIEGHMEKQLLDNPIYTTLALVEYQFQYEALQQLSVTTKTVDGSSTERADYTLELSTNSTVYPDYNTTTTLAFTREGMSASVSLQGGLSADPQRRIDSVISWMDTSTDSSTSYDGHVKLLLPIQNLDYDITSHISSGESEKNINIHAHYDGQEAALVIANQEGSDPWWNQWDMSLTYPEKEVTYYSRAQRNPDGEYHYNMEIKVDNEDQFIANIVYRNNQRYEVELSVTSPHFEDLSVTTHLKPAQADFSTALNVDYGTHGYEGSLGWAYVPSTVASINAAIGWSESRYSLSGSLHKAPSQEEPHTFQLRAEWDNEQFMQFASSYKDTHQGWWSETRDVEFSLILTSTVTPVENVGIAFTHAQLTQEIQTTGELWWSDDQKLEITVTSNEVAGSDGWESNWHILTPFSVREITYTHTYQFANNQISSTSTVGWDGQEITIVLTGSLDIESKTMDSSIDLRSPFEGYEHIASTFTFQFDGNSVTSNLHSTWEPAQEFSVTLTANWNGDDYGNGDSNININIVMPWEQFPQGTVTYAYHRDDSALSGEFKIMRGEDTIWDYEVDFSTDSENGGYTVEAGFEYQLLDLVDFKIGFSHSHDEQFMTMENEFELQWESGQVIVLECEYSHDANGNANGDLKLTTPFSEFPMLEIDTDLTKSGDTYTMHKEIKVDTNSRIILDSSITCDFDRPIFVVDARLTTPYTGYERFRLEANNTNTGNVWRSGLAVEYGTDQRIELTGSFGLDETKEFSLAIRTPFEEVQNIGLLYSYTGVWYEYTSRTEFRAQPYLEYEYVSTQTFSASDLDNILLEYETTHSSEPKEHLRFTHQLEDNGHYKTELDYTLNGPDINIKASHDLELALPRVLHSISSLEWEEGHPIELDIHVINDNRKDFSMVLNVPDNVSPIPDLQVEISHEGTHTDFTSFAIVRADSNEMILARVVHVNTRRLFKLNTEGHVNGILTNPVTPVAMNITVHRSAKFDFTSDMAMVHYDGRRMSTYTVFTYTRPAASLTSTINTPFEGYETITLSWNLEKNSDNTNVATQGSVTYGEDTIQCNLGFIRDRRRYRYVLSLITPFDEVSSLSISNNHTGRWYEMTQDWEVIYNGDRYHGDSNFRMTKKAIRGGANFHIPDTYSLSFNHKGFTVTDWANTFEFIDASNVRYAANSHFKMADTVIEGSGAVQIPDDYGFNFHHQGPQDNFENNAEVTIQGKEYIATSKLSLESEHYRAEAGFSIPVDSKEYGIVLDKSGPMDSVKVLGTVNCNGDRYEASANYTETQSSYGAAASIATPSRYYKASLGVTGLPSNAELQVEFNNNGDVYHLTGTHIFSDDGRTSTATLTTPHEGYESFGYEISHSQSNGHTVSVIVTTPFEHFETQTARVTHRSLTDGFTTVGNLETSHPLVRNVGVDVSHEGDLSDFRTSGSLSHPMHNARFSVNHRGVLRSFVSGAMAEYNGSKIEGNISSNLESAWQSATYHLECSLTTPFENLRSAQLELTNTMDMQSGSGDLDIFRNAEHIVDLDFTANMGDSSSMAIHFRQPVSGTFTLDVVSSSTEETASAILDIDGERYTAEITMRTPDVDSRELDLVFRSPTQEVSFNTKFAMTDSALSHEMTVVWDEENDGRFHYNIQATKTQRSARTIWEGTLAVTIGPDTYEGTLYHKYNPGRLVLTIITIDKYTFKNELTIGQSEIVEFQNVFTAKHTEVTHDFVVTTDGAIDLATPFISGNCRIDVDESAISFYGKVANESPDASSTLYVAETRMGLESEYITDSQFHFIASVYNNNFNAGINTIATRSMEGSEDEINNAKLELIKETSSLVFETQNPEMDVSLTLTHVKEGENHHIQVSGHVDNVPVRGEVDMVKYKGMDVKMFYGEGHMARFYAQLVTPSTASIMAYHEDDGQRTEDLVLSVRLNTTRLVHGRAHLRPDIFDELTNAYDSQTAAETMGRVWNHPYEIIVQQQEDLGNVMAPANERAMEVYNEASRKATETLEGLRALYEDNAFHSQDVGNYVLERTAEVQAAIQELAEAGREHLETLQAQITQVQAVSAVSAVSYSEDAASWWESVNAAMDDLHTQITEGLEELSQHARAQDLQETWQQIRDLELNTEWIDTLSAQMGTHMESLEQSYNEGLVDLQDMYNEVLGRPEMAQLKEITDSLIESAQQSYQYYGIGERFRSLNMTRPRDVSAYVERMRTAIMDYMQLDRTRVTVYEPSNWEAQVEVYLPFELQSLTSIPRWPMRVRRAMLEMRNQMSGYLPDRKGSWAVWDTFYRYKPRSVSVRDWMPPYSSHATIAGKQHYMTFDKRFYEYSGECSYALAKDVIDGLFTVVVNYDTARQEKSITVKVDGHTIEVAPEYKVNVDGHRNEMPVMVGDTSVMRLGHLIRVHSPHGFTALCDLPHDRCSLNVSGWYYAKTGGLLGTYDNEPYTDFRDSSGSPIDNAASLADAWTDGNRCRVANNAQTAHPELDSDNYRLCAGLFESDDSGLRPCYMQINHTEFMQMCLHDVFNSDEPEKASCDVAAFYVDECNMVGVNIDMPRTCVPCQHPSGGEFYEGEQVQIEGDDIPRSADVVLVVSQKSCNTDLVPKLQDLVNRLDVSLGARGIDSNLYGLVGYGGEGDYSYPHIHTMDGLLMGSNTKYTQAVETLPVFESDIAEDAMAALEFAALYPFRPGVAKVLVLVPCDTCYEYSSSYNDVAALLRDRNITLTTLLQNQFQVDKTNPSTSYIFGVDSHTVFTRKDFGDLNPIGDTSLRPQVAVPKDLCTALTDLSGGALFNSRHLVESRPQAMKKFLDVMSAVIAMKGGEPTECQVCECEAPSGVGIGKTVCKPCEQRSLFFSIFPDLIENFDNFAHDSDEAAIAVSPQRVTENRGRSRGGRRRRQ